MLVTLDTTFFEEVESRDGVKSKLFSVVAFSSKGVVFSAPHGYWVLSKNQWKYVSEEMCEHFDFRPSSLDPGTCSSYPNNIHFTTTKNDRHIIFWRDKSLVRLDVDTAELSLLSSLPPDVNPQDHDCFSMSDDERYVTFSEYGGVQYDYEDYGLRVLDLERRMSTYFPMVGGNRLSQFAKKGHNVAYVGNRYWQEKDEWDEVEWCSDEISAVLDIDSMTIVRDVISRQRDRETGSYDDIQWDKVFPLKSGGFLCMKGSCLRIYTPTGRLKSEMQLPEGFPTRYKFMQLSSDERTLFGVTGSQFGPPWVFADIEAKTACVLVEQDRMGFYDEIRDVSQRYLVGFDYGTSYEARKDDPNYHIDFTHWGRDYGPIYYDNALIFRNSDQTSMRIWSRVDVSRIGDYMRPLEDGMADGSSSPSSAWNAW